jgi:ADP-heptose:LPS heptosyltransferase
MKTSRTHSPETTPVADFRFCPAANMRKTLIIRTCAVGDFVLNLPALIALQKVHPAARFTLVGNRPALELAREFIAVEAIASIEGPPWARLFYEAIPDMEFDSAIVWMKDPIVADNLRASGIPDVIRADPFPEFGHAADHLLRNLKLAGPALPDRWSPGSSDVVVHPGSGSAKKNWPHFDELMGRSSAIKLLPQNLSLVELAGYLCRCGAFVGNDSGITHLAAYLGCPTVALFGPTDPRMWGPIGRRSRIIWKTRLEDISVDEVLLTLHATHTRTGING